MNNGPEINKLISTFRLPYYLNLHNTLCLSLAHKNTVPSTIYYVYQTCPVYDKI